MTKDKLASFRIADLKRPEVRSLQKKAASADAKGAEAAGSAGFPAVEERLEKGTIESVADELRSSYTQLEELANGKNTKLKASAKKAMAAYERTADLFEYLFSTKSALQNK